MGRGDKRTAKGKRFKGSFGNTRPQKVETKTVVKAKAEKAPKKVAAEKAEKPKKAPAKKKKEEGASEE
jgi:30S ribosomal protein S31